MPQNVDSSMSWDATVTSDSDYLKKEDCGDGMPVQIKGVDPRMRDVARVKSAGFTVPGLSAAVFIQPESGE